MLYSAPQRALQVRRDDDLDRKYGLHSYTAAITLRSLDELFWEHEAYQIEFPAPKTSARSVTIKLLGEILGGSHAARDRVLASETEPALKVETEAVKYSMSNCILVDFTLWDTECVPLWGFSRALELVEISGRQQNDEDGGVDLSMSSVGGSTKRLQLRFQDNIRAKFAGRALKRKCLSENQNGIVVVTPQMQQFPKQR
ncbi:hypothetical protein BBO99_00004363 [Phytophthora kernoviae]|uniref:Uncharacterized protein n=2 Tax=Phytophthora kernoviae TaxID=325452 RepID=A0A3R7JUV0_9STRA|nr:hypothetical protein G195_004890 [Phytophthora kernoviae 00238/432]KAG2521596.1 hypothetical protein JM16_004212 [Phytophthora kernoviae]RLN80614.1 hypothetical protein BBO99_00004363 [Phytophthora kernoviae]